MRAPNSSRTIKSQKNNWKSRNDPAVEGVFRIVIQRNLKEMVDLPELKVWNMLPRTVQARMIVRIRRYGFFFTHDLEETLMRCVLTRRNYLIIYAKEKQLKGYAVKLSLAEKINIACGRGDKGRCNVTIKWQFGEITLTMLREQIADWRSRILEAFEGTTPSFPVTHEVGVQTHNDAPLALRKADSIDDAWGSFYKAPSKEDASTMALAPGVLVRHPKELKRELFNCMGNKLLSSNNAFVDKNNRNSCEINNENEEGKTETEKLKTEAEVEPWPWSFAIKGMQVYEDKSKGIESKAPPPLSSTMSPTISSRALCMRRSISTPSLDENKFNGHRVCINSPPIFGPRKVTFPKRSISRIERPLTSITPWVPPQRAPWCTVVKRYDFPNAGCSNC